MWKARGVRCVHTIGPFAGECGPAARFGDRSHGQGLTGTLIGTVRDEQGGAIRGAQVMVSSSALIGDTISQVTNEKGQLRFPALAPGSYTLEIRHDGFATRREPGIDIRGGATIERVVVLTPSPVVQIVTVDGAASRIERANPDSRRSGRKISRRFLPAGPACSTRSATRRVCRPPPRPAARSRPFPPLARAPTRTSS